MQRFNEKGKMLMGRTGMMCVVLGLLTLAVAGCKTSGPAGTTPVNVVAGTAAGTDTSYRLQVGDGLAVHFLSFPDLDDTATIGPDGHIALRLISDFQIAGMTVTEATKEANDRYEKVLRHPGVSITIRSYALQQIYVDGEVNSPGVIRSSVPLTASGAIAQAGGIKLSTAHSHGALLLRRRPDGAIVYYKLGFHGDLPGGEGDPILRTNDLIYVPRTAIASVADFLQANILRVIPIVVTPTFVHSF
jgi:protein involved in polysaccharide export with SLBB domain